MRATAATVAGIQEWSITEILQQGINDGTKIPSDDVRTDKRVRVASYAPRSCLTQR